MLLKVCTYRKAFKKNAGSVLSRISVFFRQLPRAWVSHYEPSSQSGEKRQRSLKKTPNSKLPVHNFSPLSRSCHFPGTAEHTSRGGTTAINQFAFAV